MSNRFNAGSKVKIAIGAFYRADDSLILLRDHYTPNPVGKTGEVVSGPDMDGDYRVKVEGNEYPIYVNGACLLRVRPFPAPVVAEKPVEPVIRESSVKEALVKVLGRNGFREEVEATTDLVLLVARGIEASE